MSEITWNDLPADEQELMRGALPDGYSPDTNIETARCASLARKGLAVETWGEYTLTPAGRALLPAGEAVGEAEAPDPHAAYKEYLVAREKAWDLGAAFIDYGTWLEQRLAVREADLAAALERAEKAEGERDVLREEMESNKPSYGYTVSIVLPDGSPDTMKSKGVDDHDALAYARLILERNYKDYPVKIVGISRVIV